VHVLAVASALAMNPFYLYQEPDASATLRNLADRLHTASTTTGQPRHIGFDLEWKPNFSPNHPEHPVAVVQIAYQTESYVIHVGRMLVLPDGLAQILENPRIIKVGVGIQNDARKLYRDLQVSLTSCVDLSLFVKCVDHALFAARIDRYANIPLSSPTPSPPVPPDPPPPNEYYHSESFLGPHFHRLFRGPYLTSIGLAHLARVYGPLTLTKGNVRRSNWEAQLTQSQITYAALDGYAGYIVYARLLSLFHLLDPSKRPRRKYYAFDCIRGSLYHCSGDNKRSLLEDDDDASHSVPDEIALHLQGVGVDQPRGLDCWFQSCEINPEYDPGPLPPRKTPEEKEAARLARRKKSDTRTTMRNMIPGQQQQRERVRKSTQQHSNTIQALYRQTQIPCTHLPP
jgi:hypothetical protein